MTRSDLLNPRRTLPDISLPDASGTPRRIRASGDRSALLVLIHRDCGACRDWIERLASQREEIASWKGEVKVVVAASDGIDGVFPVLLDPDGRLASALALSAPAVVVADQWGEVHEGAEAGEDHSFLPIESVVEWIRHLATQCPECEGEAL